MNLQPRKDSIVVQNEFLYSTEMLSFKVGGITLDASKWSDGQTIKAGTVVTIGKNADASGLAQPYAKKDGTTITNAGEVYVVSHDIINKTGVNQVVGAVQEGYLAKTKITGVSDYAALEVDSNFRLRVRG